jgi:hypothetical protein
MPGRRINLGIILRGSPAVPSGTVKWFNVTKGSRCHVEAVRAMSALPRSTVWRTSNPLMRVTEIERLVAAGLMMRGTESFRFGPRFKGGKVFFHTM